MKSFLWMILATYWLGILYCLCTLGLVIFCCPCICFTVRKKHGCIRIATSSYQPPLSFLIVINERMIRIRYGLSGLLSFSGFFLSSFCGWRLCVMFGASRLWLFVLDRKSVLHCKVFPFATLYRIHFTNIVITMTVYHYFF